MRDFLAAAKADFTRGLREAPRGFFAPVTAVVRFFCSAWSTETRRANDARTQTEHRPQVV